MAEEKKTILPISQVTTITSKGSYQLVDNNPLFLEKTIIQVDLALVTDGVKIYLPKSSVYGLGQSQQFFFQTINSTELELPSFFIYTYPYTKEEIQAGAIPDWMNGKSQGELQDYGGDNSNWYSVQLLTANRWIGVKI